MSSTGKKLLYAFHVSYRESLIYSEINLINWRWNTD